MFEKKLFLSYQEARQAIISDINTYENQPEIWQDVNTEIFRLMGIDCNISNSHHLAEILYNMFSQSSKIIQPEDINNICKLVFQTHSETGTDPETGQNGIWLETGMNNFSCKQCGTCCLPGFTWTCTDQDIIRWKHSGRQDILKRVGFRQSKTKKEPYLWINPETGIPIDYCPWLQQKRSSQKHVCLIHDLKPDVCRDFPYTRKHACKYGCRGFDDDQSNSDEPTSLKF